MELMKWLRTYLEYLSDERRVSRNTVQSYLGDLTDLIGYLEKQGIVRANELKAHHLTTYLNALRQEGRSTATIARRTVSIRSFCKYLVLQRAVEYDPAIQLEAPKAEKKPPRTVRASELDKLLEMPDTSGDIGLRDRAMLEVLYASGLRVSELVALDVEHIRLDMGFLLCLGTGGRERMVPVGSAGTAWVSRYLEEARPRLARADKQESALFLNHQGARLSRQGFWKALKKYADQSGLIVTPHTLRHSFASHLLENGADIRAVQEMLGHAAPASTQAYLPTVKSKLMEIHERNHPRAGAKRID